jgi:type VI secretion system secreted protein Hcp
MSVDYFLKIDTCPGESMDEKHKDEIHLVSFSFGESQSGTFALGVGGGGAGKVQMSDFSFTMHTNKASPKLFLACATGQHIKHAILSARKAGEKQQDYLQWKFTDLLISSFQVSGSSGGEPLPMENISFNYAGIEVEYKIQNPDGTLGAGQKCGYDLKKMAKI